MVESEMRMLEVKRKPCGRGEHASHCESTCNTETVGMFNEAGGWQGYKPPYLKCHFISIILFNGSRPKHANAMEEPN